MSNLEIVRILAQVLCCFIGIKAGWSIFMLSIYMREKTVSLIEQIVIHTLMGKIAKYFLYMTATGLFLWLTK